MVTKAWFGEHITCWCPARFTDQQTDYTNSYCFVRNTYYTPFGRTLPKSPEARTGREITYYQWVPIIVICQCVLFVVPKWVWRTLHKTSGLSFAFILKRKDAIMDLKTQSNIAHAINRWIRNRLLKTRFRNNSRQDVPSFVFRRENYLTYSYIGCCLLYLFNSIGQIYLLDSVLGNEFLTFGTDILFGENYREHGYRMLRFPTVAFCDVNIRYLNTVVPYTIQCSLPNNLLNEKIFLLLWFLLVFISVLNGFSFLDNCSIFLRVRRRQMITRFLLLSTEAGNDCQEASNDNELVEEFVEDFLSVDGVFLISVLNRHIGSVATSCLVGNLWEHFNDHKNNDEKDN